MSNPKPELDFEGALKQLETIVANLERGEPELSTALANYERGVRLLAQCHQLLEGAERSVAVLSGVDESGNPVTAPFDATATTERESAPKTAPKTASKRSTRATPPPPADDEDDLVPF